MDTRDALAAVLFVGTLVAGCLAEYYCGNDSGRCKFDWGSVYPGETYTGGHCGRAQSDAGLGDPLLSVSSLLFVAPIAYIGARPPVAVPLVAVYAGIASFLFHAANTETSHTLDYIGVVLVAPAVLADVLAAGGWPNLAGLWFACALAANVMVRTLAAPGAREVYLYAFTSTVTVAVVAVGWYRCQCVGCLPGPASRTKGSLPAFVFIVAGAATLIAANASPQYWGCIDTQLAEPHFYGHVLMALGLVLFCRAVRNGDYAPRPKYQPVAGGKNASEYEPV